VKPLQKWLGLVVVVCYFSLVLYIVISYGPHPVRLFGANKPSHQEVKGQVETEKEGNVKEKKVKSIEKIRREEVERVSEKNVIVITGVNCGYLDFATNWAYSLLNLSILNFLFIADDLPSAHFLENRFPGHVVVSGEEVPERGKRASEYKAVGFKDICSKRPTWVRLFYLLGFDVLYADIDAVWLQNPFPVFFGEEAMGELEFIAADDSRSGRLNPLGLSGNLCSCLLYFRHPPSNTTLNNPLRQHNEELAYELIKRWEKRVKDYPGEMDQESLNQELPAGVMDGLKFSILPRLSFPNGRNFMSFPDGTLPFVVHNNWIIGHSAKKKRFKQFGLWNVSDVEFPRCESSNSRKITSRRRKNGLSLPSRSASLRKSFKPTSHT